MSNRTKHFSKNLTKTKIIHIIFILLFIIRLFYLITIIIIDRLTC